MRNVITTILVFILVMIGAALVCIYSGAYNVAASDEDAPMMQWLFHTTMERSVAARAEELAEPLASDSNTLATGFDEYRHMCELCHGAPGVEPSEIGKGLNPPPPKLEEEEFEPGELLWIVRHGIKMSGMPAFGETHSDDALRAVAAFVVQLPEMSPSEYAAWAQRAGPQQGSDTTSTGEQGHVHASGERHVH